MSLPKDDPYLLAMNGLTSKDVLWFINSFFGSFLGFLSVLEEGLSARLIGASW